MAGNRNMLWGGMGLLLLILSCATTQVSVDSITEIPEGQDEVTLLLYSRQAIKLLIWKVNEDGSIEGAGTTQRIYSNYEPWTSFRGKIDKDSIKTIFFNHTDAGGTVGNLLLVGILAVGLGFLGLILSGGPSLKGF